MKIIHEISYLTVEYSNIQEYENHYHEMKKLEWLVGKTENDNVIRITYVKQKRNFL